MDIKSYMDWKDFLTHSDVEIFDEYHEKIEIKDFFVMVDSTAKKKPHDPGAGDRSGWMNNSGYTFLEEDFW